MKRGAIRTLISAAYKDLDSWAAPEIAVFGEDVQRIYLARRHAVEGYACGQSFDEIEQQTGKSRSEVKRLVNRCVMLGPDGRIFGFWSLVPGWRVRGYDRIRPITHQKGDGSGGCAGALTQLFERYPEVEALVRDLYFGKRKKDALPEVRTSICDIHVQFKEILLRNGFTDDQWPFNTENVGYKSLARYLKNLRTDNSKGVVKARSGTDAARRHSVGNGIKPLIPILRPYSFTQLDYHKIDAASVIIIKNDFGEEFEVPISRWHVGLLIEEQSSSVLGFSIVLALNPSGDDALEVIQNAIMPVTESDPSVRLTDGDHVVINQIIPELSHQCFSVIRVDNAWANAATSVVNNIIGTVGAAVNFGPVYAWWRRPLIERIFGALTRRGLQRMPSSYGSGPSDTKVGCPNAAAATFRIELNELIRLFKRCIREHNHKSSEGLQFSSPVKRLQLALETPASGLFPQPLPHSIQQYCPLMMYSEEVTVRGNLDKNIRPYFNFGRTKHTNEKLANSYHLVGKKLIVYVDRRLARNVVAVVKETGEQLGQMNLAGAWANSCASLRDRQQIIRSGMTARYYSSGKDPMQQQREEKEAQLAALNKAQRQRSSRTALEVENARRQEGKHALEKHPETSKPSSAAVARKHDPLGLTKLPNIAIAVRRR